jgi:hypothetical protein
VRAKLGPKALALGTEQNDAGVFISLAINACWGREGACSGPPENNRVELTTSFSRAQYEVGHDWSTETRAGT